MCGGNVSRAEEEDHEDVRWSNTSILPLGASISNTHPCLHAKEYKCNITSYCSTVLKIFLLFHIIIPVLLFLIHKF